MTEDTKQPTTAKPAPDASWASQAEAGSELGGTFSSTMRNFGVMPFRRADEVAE